MMVETWKHLSVDLDSTLADTRHRKGIIEKYVAAGKPVDWDEYAKACLNDPPTPTVALIQMWQKMGGFWHVVSGRSEGARFPTALWLEEHGLTPLTIHLEDDPDKHTVLGHAAWKIGRVLEVAQEWPIFAHIDDWAEVGDYLNANTEIRGITVVPPGMYPAHRDNPTGAVSPV